MAHIAKYTKAQCGHLIRHNLREKDELGQYISFGQSFVHPERTHLNYQLGPEDPRSTLEKRLSEVKLQKRADVKVFCSWVVTLPKDGSVKPDEQRAFFESAYRHLCNEYGEKNVVCASVHMDETTPHLHFGFIPVVPDKKHPGREKVSAKELITPTHLKNFHKSLKNAIEGDLGHSVGVTLAEDHKEALKALQGDYKSISELKTETIKAKTELDTVRNQSIEPPPKVEVPPPKFLQSKEKYGLECVESALEQLNPHWKIINAKARERDDLKAENDSLAQRNHSLETDLQNAKGAISTLQRENRSQREEIRTLKSQVKQQEKQIQTQSRLLEFYRRAEEKIPALKTLREEIQERARRTVFYQMLEQRKAQRKRDQQRALRERLEVFSEQVDRFNTLVEDRDLAYQLASSPNPARTFEEIQKKANELQEQRKPHRSIRRSIHR